MSLRLPASDLIEAVVDNMRQNLEHLKYSILAPSRYVVYLHPTEHARLEGILPRLRAETIRALEEELHRLNRRSFLRRSVGRVTRQPAPVQSASPDWYVEFVRDPDGELEEGAMLIDSELVLPAQPDLGVGERTRRLTSSVSPNRSTTTREEVVSAAGSSATQAVFARLSYEDRAGRHTHEVVKDSITIGRGGIAYPVDIRVSSSEDVSREHARIRRDPQTGRFFLIDLSRLGTTLNGRHVPRGYEEADGARRENGAETPLPDRGRIGLADTLYLDFERIS
ncbi:MAG: FHA domain-containing protein [Acidobacteriota bacterium]